MSTYNTTIKIYDREYPVDVEYRAFLSRPAPEIVLVHVFARTGQLGTLDLLRQEFRWLMEDGYLSLIMAKIECHIAKSFLEMLG